MKTTQKDIFPLTNRPIPMARAFVVLSALVFSCLMACSTPQESTADSMPSPLQEEPTLFPDTSFASVDELQYQIDLFDSITDDMPNTLDDLYADAPGIMTFRGGALRNAPFVGHIQGRPDTVIIDWKFTTAYDGRQTDMGIWGGGTGWTGQPLYVHWPDSCMNRFRNESTQLTDHFSNDEIIVGSLCSRIYFINFATGDSSRQSLSVLNPIKGTVSLDPTLNGNLYVGQGVPNTQPFGALTVNLYKHRISHFFPRDNKAWRGWGGYDSSPIRIGQFLFRPAENGTLYKFRIKGDSLLLHSTLKFKKKGSTAAGMESSMAYYRNYGFVTDNHGRVLCFNLATLQPVWSYDNHDDSDATPVLALEEGHPYLYTGCEVDRQGSGWCYVVKLDALTGERIWEQRLPAHRGAIGEHKFDGGLFATPLLGVGNCKNLLFLNVVTNDKPGLKGEFVALNRADGSIAYRVSQSHYAWASPVAFLNEKDEMFVFNADCIGRVFLYNGKDGSLLYSKQVGANFEASPIVVDNHVVIGSRGRSIFRLTVGSTRQLKNSN